MNDIYIQLAEMTTKLVPPSNPSDRNKAIVSEETDVQDSSRYFNIDYANKEEWVHEWVVKTRTYRKLFFSYFFIHRIKTSSIDLSGEWLDDDLLTEAYMMQSVGEIHLVLDHTDDYINGNESYLFTDTGKVIF